ncbi:hypothetical protein [Carnobacterium sp. FSL E2-0243]|uniref:hypothetical protein n=1 Tax=Carnobacterium sp. FSL E2-0243 TaxID=2921365 RepID=UPI0030FA4AC6
MLHPIEEALGTLGYANMHYTSVSNNEEKYADRIAAEGSDLEQKDEELAKEQIALMEKYDELRKKDSSLIKKISELTEEISNDMYKEREAL